MGIRFSRDQKETMSSYLYLLGIVLVGFVVYFFIRDKIFDNGDDVVLSPPELFSTHSIPAPASIEIRQASSYPPQVVASSGPNAPSQAPPSGETVVYAEPQATDPYHEQQESSDIPENLRHPERSFRPTPLNDNTSLAVQSGVASNRTQVSNDNSQQFQTEIISGGGEFMPGIFANDTFNDASFSSF
jgi:hypothetical protein